MSIFDNFSWSGDASRDAGELMARGYEARGEQRAADKIRGMHPNDLLGAEEVALEVIAALITKKMEAA